MARNIARDEREAERRKKQLLEAGLDLFSRHGIEAISLQMVADTAEVGVATLYKYYQNKLNLVIAISEQTRRDLVSFFKIPETKIEVLYQGCDPVFSQPVAPAQMAAVRAAYQLPDSYILYVGSIEERKNLLLLLQAVPEIFEKGFVFLSIVTEHANPVV